MSMSLSGQGVLPLWLLHMRDDARLRSPCWSSHANYCFTHGGAAKPTGTNNLWHTAVWVLIDYLLFRRRWFALDEPCKMTIIEWNFDLTKINALVFGDGNEVKKACKHTPSGVFLADLTFPLSTHINSHHHPTLNFGKTTHLICLSADSAKVIWKLISFEKRPSSVVEVLIAIIDTHFQIMSS